MTLTAIPKGICSWTFLVFEEGSEPFAEVRVASSDEGLISFGETRLIVGRTEAYESSWRVKEGDVVLFEMRCPSAFKHELCFTYKDTNYAVKSTSWMMREFQVVAGEQACGLIRPKHSLTRRASLEFDDGVPTLIQLLSLWYVMHLWYQSSDS